MLKSPKKHSITSRNYTLTCFRTLKEVTGILRLERPKRRQKISKT